MIEFLPFQLLESLPVMSQSAFKYSIFNDIVPFVAGSTSEIVGGLDDGQMKLSAQRRIHTVPLGSGVSITVGGGEKTLVRAVTSAPLERDPPLALYYIVGQS